MIQKFHDMLQNLASVAKNNLYLVDTRGTIAAGDWSNEIHPNPDGFYKLAQKYVLADNFFQGAFGGFEESGVVVLGEGARPPPTPRMRLPKNSIA